MPRTMPNRLPRFSAMRPCYQSGGVAGAPSAGHDAAMRALWVWVALAAAPAQGEPLTRARAVADALAESPALKVARAQLEHRRAEVTDAARLVRDNPTVEAEYGGDVQHPGEYRAAVGI